jgi:hypothetical protein
MIRISSSSSLGIASGSGRFGVGGGSSCRRSASLLLKSMSSTTIVSLLLLCLLCYLTSIVTVVNAAPATTKTTARNIKILNQSGSKVELYWIHVSFEI